MNNPEWNDLVVDGLICYCDGTPDPLIAGRVDAANVTVVDYHCGLEESIDQIGMWLHRVHAPDSKWHIVRSVKDIRTAHEAGKAGLIMGFQNSLPIANQLDRVNVFHALGIRVIQLTYNEANAIADGCAEPRGAGLSAFGGEVVKRMNEVGIAVDLSHCSEKTILDVCRVTKAPVLLTHANAKAVNDLIRNKSDEVIRAVAATGGLIGLSVHGFMNWDGDPSRPPSLATFVEHVQHAVSLVGVEHVAIGTDLPCVRNSDALQSLLDMTESKYSASGRIGEYIRAFGNTLEGRYPPGVSSLSEFGAIREALRQAGFSEAQVAAIAGQNFCRVLEEIWA